MTELITLRQRHAIYNACFSLIRLLSSAIAHGRHEEILNEPLRKRLVHAAMTCPGFTVVQKDNIATIVDMSESRRLEYGLPRFASSWLHLYALSPKANFPLDMIEVSDLCFFSLGLLATLTSILKQCSGFPV